MSISRGDAGVVRPFKHVPKQSPIGPDSFLNFCLRHLQTGDAEPAKFSSAILRQPIASKAVLLTEFRHSVCLDCHCSLLSGIVI